MAREEIIGRKREIALLDSYMATVKPEFVALYGRRRIGKTFLVKKLYEESFDFYKTVLEFIKYLALKTIRLFSGQVKTSESGLFDFLNTFFHDFAFLVDYGEILAHVPQVSGNEGF